MIHARAFIGLDDEGDKEPRIRIFQDVWSVSPVSDRHRRGENFPASFNQEGWLPSELKDHALEIFTARDDMQEYFDKHFNEAKKKKKEPKVRVMADKKSSTRIVRAARR